MTDDGHRDEVARLVHDLRTPLAIVAGFAELLERRGGQLSAEQHAEYLTRIRESAARMGELLDEVH
jgi:signal transduction histidine kinase